MGIIYSASTLVSIYHESAAEQLIREAGLKWSDLRRVGTEKYDRDILRKVKGAFDTDEKREESRP